MKESDCLSACVAYSVDKMGKLYRGKVQRDALMNRTVLQETQHDAPENIERKQVYMQSFRSARLNK